MSDTDFKTITRENVLKSNYSGQAQTAAGVLELAGLDWTVSMQPVFDGAGNEIKKHRRVNRDDNGATLGMVKGRYVPIQNAEALSFLDAIVDSGEAKYECAWHRGGGETLGVTMSLPQGVKIAGFDPHEIYIIARISHNGGGAIQLCATPMRLACVNMVRAATKKAVQTFRVPHVAGGAARLAQARQALDVTFAYTEAWELEVERMVNSNVTDSWVDDAITKIFNTEKMQSVAKTCFETSPTIADAWRMTQYGFYNAMTETAQHLRHRDQWSIDSFILGPVQKACDRAYQLVSA